MEFHIWIRHLIHVVRGRGAVEVASLKLVIRSCNLKQWGMGTLDLVNDGVVLLVSY